MPLVGLVIGQHSAMAHQPLPRQHNRLHLLNLPHALIMIFLSFCGAAHAGMRRLTLALTWRLLMAIWRTFKEYAYSIRLGHVFLERLHCNTCISRTLPVLLQHGVLNFSDCPQQVYWAMAAALAALRIRIHSEKSCKFASGSRTRSTALPWQCRQSVPQIVLGPAHMFAVAGSLGFRSQCTRCSYVRLSMYL